MRWLALLLIVVCASWSNAGMYAPRKLVASATSSYWESFDATDGVEISTLSGWSLSTDGTATGVLVSTSSPIQAGTGAAQITCTGESTRSIYRRSVTHTSRYALYTVHFYAPTGDGNNYKIFSNFRGNSGASELAWIRFADISTTEGRLQLYAGGDVQTLATVNRGEWHKVELMFDSTDYDVVASVNDGANSSAFSLQANYALSHIQIDNECTGSNGIRIDSINYSDGGTL